MHHRYPKTLRWDADVEQTGPLCIFPGENLKKYHRFQHLYIFLLYPLFLLNWLFVRDFRDFFSTKRVVRKVLKIPAEEYLNLIVFKSFYLLLIIGVPVFIDRANLLQAFTGLLMMTVTGSLLGRVILLTPHINEDNIFPDTDENSKFHESWFRQQFLTTNDIKENNWFVRHVMGNFNYHLCHHLFPGISSVYAPEVTQVIEKFAHENSLPYRSLTLTEALGKHYRLIYKNAQFARREYLI